MKSEVTNMENEIAALPMRAQVAFAAICAERALREGAKFSKYDVLNDKRLRQALDFAWRYVEGEEVDYQKEIEPTHLAIAQNIPDVDEPGSDEALTETMSAVARMLVIFEQPERSAAAAASVANAMLALVTLVYEDLDQAEKDEEAWQRKALDLLKQWGEKPLSRHMFDSIPEYERGAVYSVFKKSGN